MTFIRVAPDCPVQTSVVPVMKGEQASIPVLEHGLLSSDSYVYIQFLVGTLVEISR